MCGPRFLAGHGPEICPRFSAKPDATVEGTVGSDGCWVPSLDGREGTFSRLLRPRPDSFPIISRQKRLTVSLATVTFTSASRVRMSSHEAPLERSSRIHSWNGIICANFLGSLGSYFRASSAKRAFVSSDVVATFIIPASKIFRLEIGKGS